VFTGFVNTERVSYSPVTKECQPRMSLAPDSLLCLPMIFSCSPHWHESYLFRIGFLLQYFLWPQKNHS